MSTPGADANTSEIGVPKSSADANSPNPPQPPTPNASANDQPADLTQIASIDAEHLQPASSTPVEAEHDLSLTAQITGSASASASSPSAPASAPTDLSLTEQLAGADLAAPSATPAVVDARRYDGNPGADLPPPTGHIQPVDTLSTFGFGLSTDDEATTETARLRLAETAIAVLRTGKFRHGRALGEGGAGMVTAAFDLSLKRDLAIKTLKSPDDTNLRIRFIDEAQITGQLQHPNIVPVYELALGDDSNPMLVMKRVHGKTLRALIREIHEATPIGERLSTRDERRLLDAFLKICDAIAFAHSKRVIHRDLKPENVMVGEYGEVLVMDWGLAKPLDSAETHIRDGRKSVISDRRMGSIEVSIEGAVSGTLPYMPPEQAHGGERLTETADVYSLGAILYVMLTNMAPFTSTNRHLMREQVMSGSFMRPSEAAHERVVPSELEAIVLKAMRRSRRERYPSVDDLREDVERYLDGKTVSVGSYTAWDRFRKWVDHNRAVAAGIAATLAAVMIGLIVAIVLVNEAELARRAKAITELEAERSVAQEAERRAISEQKLAEQARERDELAYRALLQEGKIDALAEALGVAAQASYDELVNEFTRLHNEMIDQGLSQPAISKRIGPRRFKEYLQAFEDLFAAHKEHPEAVRITSRHWRDRGVLHYHAGGGYEVAKADLQTAVNLAVTDADAAEALMLLGVIAADEGDLPAALRYLNQSLAKQKTVYALFNRAVALRMAGRYDDALTDLDTFLGVNAEDGAAWAERAVVQHHLGETDKAWDDIQLAIELNGEEPVLLLTRGLIQLARKDLREALADFEVAAAALPDDPLCHFNTALALAQLGRYLEALEHVSRALLLHPRYVDAHVLRGQMYEAVREYDTAIEAFSAAIAIDSKAVRARYHRAYSARQMGNFELALADAQRAHELDPTDPDVRYELAQAHMHNRDYRAAIADFTYLIDVESGSVWAHYVNRGIAHAYLNEDNAARRDFATALSRAPPDRHDTIRQLRREVLGE